MKIKGNIETGLKVKFDVTDDIAEIMIIALMNDGRVITAGMNGQNLLTPNAEHLRTVQLGMLSVATNAIQQSWTVKEKRDEPD